MIETNKRALRIGIIALIVGLCASSSYADLYWETESVSTNVPHQSDGTTIQRYYFTPHASRVELGGIKIYIVNYNTMELYTLDTKAKTWAELNLGEQLVIVDGAADKKKMSEMLVLGAMMAIRITPTNELKTIAGYRCRKYDVHLGIIKGEYWVSEEVRCYQELRTLGAKVGAAAERYPILKQIDVAGMVKKLGGFPVYTVNHVMGGTVESTLRKVEQKSLDPKLFVVPKEYKMKKGG